jgi:hypothetical protein
MTRQGHMIIAKFIGIETRPLRGRINIVFDGAIKV